MRMVFPPHVPGRFINELASDVNTLVGSILGEEPALAGFTPAMDIEETEAGYKLTLDVPGINPDNINIEIEDGHVTIHGERHAADESDDVTWRRTERVFGEFRRKFRLPKIVDQERIEADYENGVLTVMLPKIEKKPAKRVVVSHGGSNPNSDDSNSGS